jgi:hypothetical protein
MERFDTRKWYWKCFSWGYTVIVSAIFPILFRWEQ